MATRSRSEADLDRRRSTASDRSLYSAESLGRHKLHPHPHRQVRVPLIEDVHELKRYADTHFRGEYAGMYHHGRHPIKKHAHAKGVRHEDHVVLARKERAPQQEWATTAKAAFVEHAMEPRPCEPPLEVTVTKHRLPQSTMKEHYPGHAVAPRPQFEPPERPRPKPFEGTKTSADYVPHDIEPRRYVEPESPVRTRAEPLPSSTMKEHFPAHPLPQRRPGEAPEPPRTGKFDGESTMKATYKKHAIDKREPGPPPSPPPRRPFEGSTEHKDAYIKHPGPPKQEYFYLSLEHLRSKRSSASGSVADFADFVE